MAKFFTAQQPDHAHANAHWRKSLLLPRMWKKLSRCKKLAVHTRFHPGEKRADARSTKKDFHRSAIWPVYGAPFVKILYLADLAQKLLSLRRDNYLCSEIAISACIHSAEACRRKTWYPVWRKTWCSVSVIQTKARLLQGMNSLGSYKARWFQV